ncbi:quinolinate synthetase [Propionispira arboris]|uniref:Quinolinate synthase n=1 Tax=Propionispira arboris TaxID=84035 RepID=A0A1H6TBM9_9FIRM|nr:quinolinate synthase NadA [Propionispira arboris]SEI77469.1 quinolinate synthetase [Propionispira arboris]
MKNLVQEIEKLKKERRAVILAHVYQPPEIQAIADYTGDSFGLSQQAAATNAEVIVFCGVHFMAETAAILSPEKTILLPALDAGCLMFDDMIEQALKKKIQEKPDAVVVSYVNTPAAVKAMSDICCTSANAVAVVESIARDKEIIFVPDRNLASYVQEQTNANIFSWPSCCPTHARLSKEELQAMKEKHPQALVLMHPECEPEVRGLADFIGSTTNIVKEAKRSPNHEFIIATEQGVLYQLEKACPEKSFYLASDKMVCSNMKKTTLEKVKSSLIQLEPRIIVPEETRLRAVGSLKKMLAICG